MADEARLRELFDRVIDLPDDQQESFLNDECAGDTELLDELREMLSADREASTSWDRNALHHEAMAVSRAGDAALGQTFGSYRIVERIGAGGMGSVYRAVRVDAQFDKSVAIKRILAGFDNSQIIARFKAERQILARLEHPNIARLIDGGADQDQLPYLVMEYVEGTSPLPYCEQRKLTIRQRLELFRQICSAVQYAHQQLVIHRDLKPGNILITAEGVAKLLDFGIAKVLTEENPESAVTAVEARIVTARYASPEQISGEAVGTASDMFSLGILLYELLTGRSPYGEPDRPSRELLAAVCFEEPKPPSTYLRELRGDLDAIILKALRKNPAERYASADQFSEDIQRYLEGRPVRARREAFSYVAGKFLRRNWLAATAGLIAVIALVGGVIAVNIARARAERRFEEVKALAHSYLFEVYDGLNDLQGSLNLRQLVVQRALTYLDNLSRERGSDLALSRELGNAYFRVAAIQGAPDAPNLGDAAGAAKSYQKALAIRKEVGAASPGDVEVQLELADAYAGFGMFTGTNSHLADGVENLSKAVAIVAPLAGAHPKDVKILKRLTAHEINLGSLTGDNDFPNLGDIKGAMDHYQKAETICEQIEALAPGDMANRINLATVHLRIGSLHRINNDNEAALKEFQAAVRIGEEILKEDPLNASIRRDVAVESRTLSLIYMNLKKPEEAKAPGDRSAELFGMISREDPKNIQAQEELADSIWSQGFVLEGLKDFAGAFQRYQESIALYERLMAANPGHMPRGRRSAYQLVGGLAAKLGDPARSIPAAQKQLEIDAELLKQDANNVNAQENRGVALLQIAQSYEVRGQRTHNKADFAQALEWDRKSMEVWQQLKKDNHLSRGYSPFLDRTSASMARCEKALAGR